MVRSMYLVSLFIFLNCGTGVGTERQTVCFHGDNCFKNVEYVRNYDGDTITVNIPNTHPIIGVKMPIRVAGIDTPEIKGKTECERNAAKKAQKLVQELLQNAKSIDLLDAKRGRYFRIVADVKIDGVSISATLIKEGLAYPYDGGKKQDIDWCARI